MSDRATDPLRAIEDALIFGRDCGSRAGEYDLMDDALAAPASVRERERLAQAVVEAAEAVEEAERLSADASQHRDWDTLDFLNRGAEARLRDLARALAALRAHTEKETP